MPEHMLTTEDNPFSPVTQFDEWRAWDQAAGYHTLELLARLTFTSDELSEADQSVAIENGIDEVIELHGDGFYKKVPISQ